MNPDDLNKIKEGVRLLEEAKIPYQGNERLYQAFKDDPFYTHKLAPLFVQLNRANIFYQENENFYETLIDNACYADRLKVGFMLLEKAAIPYKNNEDLYQSLTRNILFSPPLAFLIAQFKKLNIGYQENFALYQALFRIANPTDLAKTIGLLDEANITYQGNELLYKFIVYKPDCVRQFVLAFVELKKNNIPYQGNEAFYKMLLLEAPSHSYMLVSNFIKLNKEGISYQENELLYKAIINTHYSIELVSVFVELKKNNILYHDNKEFYNGIIKCPMLSGIELPIFLKLYKEKITYKNFKDLYQTIFDNLGDLKTFSQVLDFLYKLNINPENYPEYFNKNLLIYHGTLALHVFTTLETAGYSLQTHESIFHILLKKLNNENLSYQSVLNSVNQISEHAKTIGLLSIGDSGFEKQLKDLESIIELNTLPWDSLAQGPLNKSKATIKVENLLEKIIKLNDVSQTVLSFNASKHYILNLPGEKEINLSLLIKNANLSQLYLNPDLINKIDPILRKLLPEELIMTSNNPIVKLLPAVQEMAIEIYITEHFENINKLFRLERLSSIPKFNDDDNKNKLACFIMGCLLNDAANKISVLVDSSSEKVLLEKIARHNKINMADYVDKPNEFNALIQKSYQAGLINTKEYLSVKAIKDPICFYPKIILLDRGEESLTEETINARKAGPWTFPALTSFSIDRNYSSSFTTRTKIENPPKCYVINEDEQEVILSHGTMVITTQGANGLVSAIKNSPSLEPKNHYWSDLALTEAFENYLSKEYEEEASAIILNGKRIVRPNHNSPHVYRVMIGTEQVTNYFAHFAKDKGFKAFCCSLTDDEREWLRVAAAFSITGRESEMSAGENIKLYEKYRQGSCEHFIKFLDKTTDMAPLDMKERMIHVLRYMGNPNYEGQINNHPDEKERQIRNFYHRILSVAHKMDLPRDYSAEEYAESMIPCRKHSEKSKDQENALNEMIRYNIQLIKAHGSQLHCDIKANGELVNVSYDYKESFAKPSRSMKKLFEMTRTVPKPMWQTLESRQEEKLKDEGISTPDSQNNNKHKIVGVDNVSIKKMKI